MNAANNSSETLMRVDGSAQDDYVVGRVAANKMMQGVAYNMRLVDLTTSTSISHVDGKVLTQLILSGYAKTVSYTHLTLPTSSVV